MSTHEVAGRWVAVSTGGQDERDQEPQIDRWIADHGYATGPTYRMQTSRYKGTKVHAEMLDRVIDDMKNGVINVLVVFQSSRIERRGAYNVFDLARRVNEANGRIEYVRDLHLNTVNDMTDVQLALNATMDKLSSKAKSDAVIKSHDARREVGALIGRPSFGFTTEAKDYTIDGKTKTYRALVPNEWSGYVKQIFVKIGSGQSVISVCEWLDSEGVPTNSTFGSEWSSKSVTQIIRNRAYLGTRTNSEGDTAHECPAIVTVEDWDKANAVLDASPRGKRGPKTNDAPMMSGIECGNCQGKMYRIFAGSGDKRIAYYRCSGRKDGANTKPKGCGYKMVRCDVLDAQVSEHMSYDTSPIMESRFVEGTDKEGELAKLSKEVKALNLKTKEGRNRSMEIYARMDELDTMDIVADEWVSVDTGETVASKWAGMDNNERRVFLSRKVRIVFTWLSDGDELISVITVLTGADTMPVSVKSLT